MLRASRIPAAACAAVLSLAAAASAWVHVLIPGQKAFGLVSQAGEVDEVWVQAGTGWTLTFVLGARKGEALLPVFTKLTDPDGADRLGEALVKANPKGTRVKLKFAAAKSGWWVLGISGASGTTGTWDLSSKGPAVLPLGPGSVDAAGGEVLHGFDADPATEATLQAKAAPKSLLRPLIARLLRPEGAGDADLSAALRKTTPKKDTLKKFPLPDRGTWILAVTGADGTTGTYAATLKVGKKVPLDFTADPPPGPPPPPPPGVAGVSPPNFTRPSSGTETKAATVQGTGFQDGATVSITASSGTNGISNVVATFVSEAELSLAFDLSSSASLGTRTVTVTNPDAKSGSLAAALAVDPPAGMSVTSVTPSQGSGAGGTRVLVQGTLFGPAPAVTFGGVPAGAVNAVDPFSLFCTVPTAASLSPTAGTPVDVVVDNGGGSAATLAGGFTYDPDPTAPRVLATVPAVGATGVATNLQKVVFVMTEPMSPNNVNAGNFDFFRSATSGANDILTPRVAVAGLGPGNRFVVIGRGPAVGGTMSTNSTYIGQIHNGGQTSGFLADPAGNVLDPSPFAGTIYQTNFATGTATDGTAPTVILSVPANNATGVDVDASPGVTFSEAVDPTTLAAAISLTQGGSNVPFDLTLEPLCRSLVVTPRGKLLASTTYVLGVSTALRDLALNPLGANVAITFTTAAADGTAPTQAITVDRLPVDLNGSSTFVPGTSNGGSPSAPGAATAWDVYVPLHGFAIDVEFSDFGGSGVDPSTFSCTSSAAMGSVGAGQELASFFTVNPLRATWTVDPSRALAAGNDVSFTVQVSDHAGNPSGAATVVVDAADIAGVPAGKSGDRDPFNQRQSWLLRFDQDLYAIAASAGGAGSHTSPLTITSSLGADGTSDFRQDLGLVGLNGPETGTNAATVTNGSDTGTNAIVRTLVKRSVRGWLRRRYGIAFDGTRGADAAEIEFLLEGETLAAGGTATSAGWTSAKGYSMMTFTGDERANASGGAIGRATFDQRNRFQEDDSNTGAADGSNVGTFATHMIRVRINDPANTSFPGTFDPLISLNSRGGTPVGTSNDDAVILGPAFDYSTASAARRARFDLVMTAVDRYGLYLSAVGAHEIGHSTGLVPDGAPPNGLFGNAHPNNTFVATSNLTTANHLDVAGPNVMAAAASFDEAIATGSDFMVFEPLSLAWLLRRTIHDQ
jgi:hypothetical protein